MKLKEIEKINEDAEERISDLMDIKRYPPFTIFYDKAKKLRDYVGDTLINLQLLGEKAFAVNDNDETYIDESQTEALKAWADLKKILTDGDKGIEKKLLDDIEEARLYRKRHDNNPQKALYAAAKIYPEADISMVVY